MGGAGESAGQRRIKVGVDLFWTCAPLRSEQSHSSCQSCGRDPREVAEKKLTESSAALFDACQGRDCIPQGLSLQQWHHLKPWRSTLRTLSAQITSASYIIAISVGDRMR